MPLGLNNNDKKSLEITIKPLNIRVKKLNNKGN
jgi:hypothetical protein